MKKNILFSMLSIMAFMFVGCGDTAVPKAAKPISPADILPHFTTDTLKFPADNTTQKLTIEYEPNDNYTINLVLSGDTALTVGDIKGAEGGCTIEKGTGTDNATVKIKKTTKVSECSVNIVRAVTTATTNSIGILKSNIGNIVIVSQVAGAADIQPINLGYDLVGDSKTDIFAGLISFVPLDVYENKTNADEIYTVGLMADIPNGYLTPLFFPITDGKDICTNNTRNNAWTIGVGSTCNLVLGINPEATTKENVGLLKTTLNIKKSDNTNVTDYAIIVDVISAGLSKCTSDVSDNCTEVKYEISTDQPVAGFVLPGTLFSDIGTATATSSVTIALQLDDNFFSIFAKDSRMTCGINADNSVDLSKPCLFLMKKRGTATGISNAQFSLKATGAGGEKIDNKVKMIWEAK